MQEALAVEGDRREGAEEDPVAREQEAQVQGGREEEGALAVEGVGAAGAEPAPWKWSPNTSGPNPAT